jgi:hypothetical protein
MRSFPRLLINIRIYPFLIIIALVSLFCALTPLSSANTPAISICVVNNSPRELRHLYLASAGSNKWGDDQISDPITAGTSRNINASWNESTVKVVVEDEDGCFLTTTLDASGSLSWTITGTTTRDCGN